MISSRNQNVYKVTIVSYEVAQDWHPNTLHNKKHAPLQFIEKRKKILRKQKKNKSIEKIRSEHLPIQGNQREENTHTKSLLDLPLNACIGSSSLRRQSQLLALRPDLQFINIRGNVQTRMNALNTLTNNSIHIDAIILAQAGLERLGIMGKNSIHMSHSRRNYNKKNQ